MFAYGVPAARKSRPPPSPFLPHTITRFLF